MAVLPWWVWGIGLGVPLVPEVWKMWDIADGSTCCTRVRGEEGCVDGVRGMLLIVSFSDVVVSTRSVYFGWKTRYEEDVEMYKWFIALGEHCGLTLISSFPR
jgi:hypothetical protein